MKASQINNGLIAILLFFLVFLFSCSDNSTEPEEISPLVGTWDLSKMTSILEGVAETYDATQLEEMNLIWTLKFQEDHTAEQITNISGPLLTVPGTWSTSENQLTLVYEGPTGSTGTMIYDYTLDENILELNWQLPAGAEFIAEFTKHQ